MKLDVAIQIAPDTIVVTIAGFPPLTFANVIAVQDHRDRPGHKVILMVGKTRDTMVAAMPPDRRLEGQRELDRSSFLRAISTDVNCNLTVAALMYICETVRQETGRAKVFARIFDAWDCAVTAPGFPVEHLDCIKQGFRFNRRLNLSVNGASLRRRWF